MSRRGTLGGLVRRHATFPLVFFAGLVVAAFAPGVARAQTGLQYFAVTPCRVVDTRSSIDPAVSKRGAYADNETRAYTFSTSTDCPGLPSTAGGWALHISFQPTNRSSFLTVYPSGVTQPGTSTLLGYPGTVTGNNAVVPAGSGGTIELYCQYAGNVIIDVNGYFAP
jgi:hypothetical protein